MQLSGEWHAGTAGGCPKHPSWTANPQYLIQPTVEGATYRLLLQQNIPAPYHAIGLWIMQADSATDRKTTLSKSQMVTKTKYKAAPKVQHSVQLPPRPNGYIVVVSTFDPQQLAGFTLTLSSEEDPAATLQPLPAGSVGAAAPLAKTVAPAPAPAPARTAPAAPPYRAAPSQPVAAVPAAPKIAAAATASGEEPSNEPVFVTEGQGLSEKQRRDAQAMIAAAAQQVASSGQPYEDADFPASAASLGAGWAHAPLVTQWRRPSEIAGGAAKLFKNDWEIEGVVLGPAENTWLMAALNLIAGDREVLDRVFVDASHGASGFYVLRFWLDDPRSEDDWQVVIVDDRLPCGSDGAPCFCRNPSSEVFWTAIVEKALAKLFGSYANTEAAVTPASQLQAIELLTGGSGREALAVQGAAAEPLWEAIQSAFATQHVVGARIDPANPEAAPAEAMGLRAGRAYCVMGAFDMVNVGRILKLRGFMQDPEWRGKWSDGDGAWTNQLRQMLSYQKRDDGTFWMGYEDFCTHFTELYCVRMADDRWLRATVRSRWQDATAGGGLTSCSWRHNYQWLLRVSRPSTRVVLTLTLPAEAAATGHAPALAVLAGNPMPADHPRRRLELKEGDLLAHAEPRLERRVTLELELPPSEAPYVLLPYLHAPGAESPFLLTVLGDAPDEAGGGGGAPAFSLEPVRKPTDWCTSRVQAPWSDAAAPPSSEGFLSNLQAPPPPPPPPAPRPSAPALAPPPHPSATARRLGPRRPHACGPRRARRCG